MDEILRIAQQNVNDNIKMNNEIDRVSKNLQNQRDMNNLQRSNDNKQEIINNNLQQMNNLFKDSAKKEEENKILTQENKNLTKDNILLERENEILRNKLQIAEQERENNRIALEEKEKALQERKDLLNSWIISQSTFKILAEEYAKKLDYSNDQIVKDEEQIIEKVLDKFLTNNPNGKDKYRTIINTQIRKKMIR